MEKHVKKSLELFDNYNCCQSIIGVYGPLLGVDQNQVLLMTTGFGAGMAYQGKTCGAVVGAYLCMGLIAGKISSDNLARKKITVQFIQEFNQKFIKQHLFLECKELLGIDVSQSGNLELARSTGVFNKYCPKFVETSAQIVDEIIQHHHLNLTD